MHHVRRHIRRAARAPRKTWRRVYRYQVDRLPMYPVKFITPISHDAPMEEEDVRFFEWVLFGLLVFVLGGLVAWAVSALA